MTIIILPIILVCIILFFIVLGVYRTWKVQHGQNQKLFVVGKVPEVLPDGFYKGIVKNYNGHWIGKEFDAKNNKGINVFKKDTTEGKQYSFKTYKGKGIQDTQIDVLKIDYNIKENPFWVRMILDEVVEVDKNEYLGKVHITLMPGIPFTVGYFCLKKASQ